MRNILLTATSTERDILINWDNVEYAKVTKSPYGDEYVEVHFGDQYVDVKETLQEIDEKLLSTHEKFNVWLNKDKTKNE